MAHAAYYNRIIRKYIEDYVTSEETEKLGGPLYWILLSVVIFEDTSDLFADIVTLGIQIIPVVGQALGAVILLMNTLLGFSITGIVFLYLYFNGSRGVSKMVTRSKFWLFKTIALMLADSIPILGMLPFTTLAFMYAVKTINKGRQKRNDGLPEEALEQLNQSGL